MSQFELEAQELINKYQIPGTAVGIAENGELKYSRGFGYRNIAQGEPVTMDTVYGTASVTKSFVCMGIMQLQEEGKLSVHDPVVNYLPTFKIKNQSTDQMTIHHLMTHTTGLPPLPTLFYAGKRSKDNDPSIEDYPGLRMKVGDDRGPIDTYDELLEFISELDIELLGEPGKEFSYSNDSYAMLGAIIEKVSGKTFDVYMNDHIFEPAGMKDTSILLEDLDKHEKVTMLYSIRRTGNNEVVYEAPVWWDSPSMRGAGAIKSTIVDMINYAEVFRTGGMVGNNRILSDESVQAMIHPHVELIAGQYYGYGLVITPDYYGGTLVEHGGNSKAIASRLVVIPERGISGMVLTNLAGVPAPTILEGALNVYEGRAFNALAIDSEAYNYTKEELQEYEGNYVSNEGMSLKVTIQNGTLVFLPPSLQFPTEATNLEKDMFLVTINDQTEVIRFVRENGVVDRVAYHFRQFPKMSEEN